MRDFYLVIPSDCVASFSEKENRQALNMMKRLLKADIRPSRRIRLLSPEGKTRARKRPAGKSDLGVKKAARTGF